MPLPPRSDVARLVLLAALLGIASPATAQHTGPTSWPTSLVAGTDTMDTYSRQGPMGPIRRGATYVQHVRREEDGAWVLQRDWLDSLGAPSTIARIRTQAQSLATRLAWVRAPADSASLLVADGRAVGWVVHADASQRLVDGAMPDRLAPEVAELGFAASLPAPGAQLTYPTYALYGPDPLAGTVDTLRAVGAASVQAGATEHPCVLVERSGGTVLWVEARTGRVLARQGQAGGGRVTWWHVLRGIEPPTAPGAP